MSMHTEQMHQPTMSIGSGDVVLMIFGIAFALCLLTWDKNSVYGSRVKISLFLLFLTVHATFMNDWNVLIIFLKNFQVFFIVSTTVSIDAHIISSQDFFTFEVTIRQN